MCVLSRSVLALAVCAFGGLATGAGDTALAGLMCKDATEKLVADDNDIVHAHFVVIQKACKNEQKCEVKAVTGIDKAKAKVLSFYIKHCKEHVGEDAADSTMTEIHTAVDKFEEDHGKEVRKALHDKIDAVMETVDGADKFDHDVEEKFAALPALARGGRPLSADIAMGFGFAAVGAVLTGFVVRLARSRSPRALLPEEDVDAAL